MVLYEVFGPVLHTFFFEHFTSVGLHFVILVP